MWSHLMCALNIRWGCKGSIQEFSTLLRAPGLPSPSQSSQATLRTRTGWNRPPSPQQQTQTAAATSSLAGSLETKQCMTAKPGPCLRPLGCSHCSSSAPPCAAHLFKDSFHRNPTECQDNRLQKQLSQIRRNIHILDTLTRWTFTFSTVASHVIL